MLAAALDALKGYPCLHIFEIYGLQPYEISNLPTSLSMLEPADNLETHLTSTHHVQVHKAN